jgi:hypothetical protein
LIENLPKSHVVTLSVEGNPRVGLLARKSISKILEANKNKIPTVELQAVSPTKTEEEITQPPQQEERQEIVADSSEISPETPTNMAQRLDTINNYRLISQIHHGEASELYQCESMDSLERFAVKITRIANEESLHFVSEVRNYDQISHQIVSSCSRFETC